MNEREQYDSAVHLLRERGCRMTPQRLEVLRILSSHEQYLSAEEIYTTIVPHQPSLDIATVYRTLQWLQDAGLVAPIATGDGKLRYEYHRHGNQHHHLVCQECGHTTQIADEIVAPLKALLQQHYGFALDDHLTLPGRCDSC